LPHESPEELPQELDSSTEFVTKEPEDASDPSTESKDDEATDEQSSYFEKLQDQVNELEQFSNPNPLNHNQNQKRENLSGNNFFD